MKILIIGAGAAGMMAAARAIELGADVVLVEKNAILGRKVLLSGGGRCNLTTTVSDVKELMRSYPRGSRWLRFAMYEFGPERVYSWFEEKGVPLKVEGSKVYPKSNKGKDITAIFDKIFAKEKFDLFLKTAVTDVKKEKGKFIVNLSDGKVIESDKLIITTGGHAYRCTGSTGDGYDFAQKLGHSITSLKATLTSFLTAEKWVKDLAGVSFEKVKFKLVGERGYEFSGPFLFTHKGVSGPAIFALSAMSAFENCDEKTPLKLFIDFVPSINREELQKQIKNKMEENPQVVVLKNLRKYVSKSLLSLIFQLLQIDGNKKSAEFGKKDLNKFVESLKNFELNLVERTPGSEIVTAGGVDLSEIDNKTMESKICPALYFAGEIMDVDGFTGGYNLQIAWATGRLAGESAAGGKID